MPSEKLSTDCEKCNVKCKTCETTIDNCKLCNGERFRHPSPGCECIGNKREGANCSCPKGYIESEKITEDCEKCPIFCVTCNYLAECTSCKGVGRSGKTCDC